MTTLQDMTSTSRARSDGIKELPMRIDIECHCGVAVGHPTPPKAHQPGVTISLEGHIDMTVMGHEAL